LKQLWEWKHCGSVSRKGCRQQEQQQHQQQRSNCNGKLLKKQATGGDCGDGRNSSSRKKVEAAWQLNKTAMTRTIKFFKQAITINWQQTDCNKEQQASLQWHFKPWYNNLAMATTEKTSSGSIGRGCSNRSGMLKLNEEATICPGW